MTNPSVGDSLATMIQRLEALPEANEPPPTTLQVLNRGRSERYWHRLLAHFLDPDAAHGLDDALLEQFLAGLSEREDLGFEFSRLDLEDARVECEVSVDSGRPDLVVWSSREWFVCLELKVDASEGDDQTRRYVDAPAFESIGLEKHEVSDDGHHYAFLAPADAPPPIADEFVPVSWEWVADQLGSFLGASYGEYPFRTTAQLEDFADTIRSEVTMTEHGENRREKVALAIEHYEPMMDVLAELERHVTSLQERWPAWFVERLPDGWDDRWTVRGAGNSYMSVARDEWVVDGTGPSDGEAGLVAYWEFRVTERHVGGNVVDHRIVVTGADDRLLTSFGDDFFGERIQREVASTVATLDGEPKKDVSVGEWDDRTYRHVVRGTYRYEFDDGDGFARTVVEAFDDLRPVFDLVSEAIPQP